MKLSRCFPVPASKSSLIEGLTQPLWRGSLLPLGCGAAPYLSKEKGTASQSNGSKLPRHR
ncbi:hypothetical protein EB795_02060 [Pseudomonas mandelii]|nr:hypothetical protein [Pseudomonas mandelii]